MSYEVAAEWTRSTAKSYAPVFATTFPTSSQELVLDEKVLTVDKRHPSANPAEIHAW